jgi:hypothetical protein
MLYALWELIGIKEYTYGTIIPIADDFMASKLKVLASSK